MKKKKKRKMKRPGSGARLFAVAAIAAVALSGLAWWVFFSDSDSEARQALLKKSSVLVDRIDQLSEEWEKRSDADRVETGSTESHAGQAEVKPAGPVSSTDRGVPETPDAQETKAKAPDKGDDITERDQEQLRELLRSLNDDTP